MNYPFWPPPPQPKAPVPQPKKDWTKIWAYWPRLKPKRPA